MALVTFLRRFAVALMIGLIPAYILFQGNLDDLGNAEYVDVDGSSYEESPPHETAQLPALVISLVTWPLVAAYTMSLGLRQASVGLDSFPWWGGRP
jgi:hypothetical protein